MRKTKKLSRIPLYVAFGIFALSLPLSVRAESVEDLIANNWDEGYYSEIVVKEGSTDITVDGKEKDLGDYFNESSPEEIVESEQTIKEYFDDETVTENKDGSYTIKSPYQTKRIVIPDAHISGYGEKDAAYDGNYTVLQFETESDTESAFREISSQYPSAYVDEVLSADSLLKAAYYSWGTHAMGMDTLKRKSFGSSTVTVAIIDSGLSPTCSVFSGRKISSKSYNIIGNNSNYRPDTAEGMGWHGTHVAGIIADSTPANVELMPIKIFDSSGDTSTLVIERGIKYATENGADIINMSFGSNSENSFLDSTLATAFSKGIVMFAAAGNEKTTVCYPARSSYVISVGSLDGDLNPNEYSNYGSALDFVAPGTDITSAAVSGGFIKASGTSMSAPHMSAAAAYIKLLYPKLTANNVYEKLRHYAVDIAPKGKDKKTGWGYVDLSSIVDDYEKEKTQNSPSSSTTQSKPATSTTQKKPATSTTAAKPQTKPTTQAKPATKPTTPAKQVTPPSTASVKMYGRTITYDGKKHTCKVKGLPKGCSVKYSYAVNAGKHKVYAYIYFNGKVIKKKYAYLMIKRAKIRKVSLKKKKYYYTGKRIKPQLNIRPGVTYKVTYKKNKKPGTGKVIVKGIGNYTGKKTLKFKIVKKKKK